jgi:hypothetical protein
MCPIFALIAIVSTLSVCTGTRDESAGLNKARAKPAALNALGNRLNSHDRVVPANETTGKGVVHSSTITPKKASNNTANANEVNTGSKPVA